MGIGSLFGFGSKATETAGPKAEVKEGQAAATSTTAAINSQAAATQALNANPGTALTPVSLKTADLEILSNEALSKIEDPKQKNIFTRYVGTDEGNVAIKSKDGNLLLPYSNPVTSRKQEFTGGVFHWVKTLFGGQKTNYAVKWLKEADRTEASLITPEIADLKEAVNRGDICSIPVFMKDAEGNFGAEPEMVLLIDNASEISKTVIDHDKLGPIAKECEQVSKNSKTRVAVIEGAVLKPGPKPDPQKLAEIFRNATEAFYMAQQHLATKDAKFKPATSLLIPTNITGTAEHGDTNNLTFNTFNKWKHAARDKDGNLKALEGVMTIATAKNAPKTLDAKFTPFLASWSQLGLGSKLPEDKVLKELALDLPQENAKLLEAFNAKVAPKPTPVTIAGEKPTAVAA